MIDLDVDKTLLQIEKIKKESSAYYNLYYSSCENLGLQDRDPRKMEMLKRTLKLLDGNSTKIYERVSQKNATPLKEDKEDTKEIRVVKMQIILKILLTMSEQCFVEEINQEMVSQKNGVVFNLATPTDTLKRFKQIYSKISSDSKATLLADQETQEIYVKNNSQNNSQKNIADKEARAEALEAAGNFTFASYTLNSLGSSTD